MSPMVEEDNGAGAGAPPWMKTMILEFIAALPEASLLLQWAFALWNAIPCKIPSVGREIDRADLSSHRSSSRIV